MPLSLREQKIVSLAREGKTDAQIEENIFDPLAEQVEKLPRAQKKVFELARLSVSQTNREIGAALNMSEQVVKNYLRKIYHYFGIVGTSSGKRRQLMAL